MHAYIHPSTCPSIHAHIHPSMWQTPLCRRHPYVRGTFRVEPSIIRVLTVQRQIPPPLPSSIHPQAADVVWFVTLHAKPTDAKAEISALTRVYDWLGNACKALARDTTSL